MFESEVKLSGFEKGKIYRRWFFGWESSMHSTLFTVVFRFEVIKLVYMKKLVQEHTIPSVWFHSCVTSDYTLQIVYTLSTSNWYKRAGKVEPTTMPGLLCINSNREEWSQLALGHVQDAWMYSSLSLGHPSYNALTVKSEYCRALEIANVCRLIPYFAMSLRLWSLTISPLSFTHAYGEAWTRVVQTSKWR